MNHDKNPPQANPTAEPLNDQHLDAVSGGQDAQTFAPDESVFSIELLSRVAEESNRT